MSGWNSCPPDGDSGQTCDHDVQSLTVAGFVQKSGQLPSQSALLGLQKAQACRADQIQAEQDGEVEHLSIVGAQGKILQMLAALVPVDAFLGLYHLGELLLQIYSRTLVETARNQKIDLADEIEACIRPMIGKSAPELHTLADANALTSIALANQQVGAPALVPVQPGADMTEIRPIGSQNLLTSQPVRERKLVPATGQDAIVGRRN